MSERCKNLVVVGMKRDFSPMQTYCGSTSPSGDVALCDTCRANLEQRYPQGWRNTPGDLCKHGTYIGDAYGPDYMCHYCEIGD